MAETVSAKEYEAFMALREQINKGIEQADSEFMLITYKKLRKVMNERQTMANNLNITLENARIREIQKSKGEQFKTGKTKSA